MLVTVLPQAIGDRLEVLGQLFIVRLHVPLYEAGTRFVKPNVRGERGDRLERAFFFRRGAGRSTAPCARYMRRADVGLAQRCPHLLPGGFLGLLGWCEVGGQYWLFAALLAVETPLLS